MHEGHPVIAIVVCLVIAIGAASGPAHFRSESAAYNIGYIFGGAAFVAAIAWVWTVRYSSLAWQIGASLTIFVVIALSTLSQVGSARQAEINDMRSAHAQMEKIAQTGEITEFKEGESPLGKMQAIALNGLLRDQKAFAAKSQETGVNAVISFEGLTHDSPVLRNCPQLASLAAAAHDVGASFPRHLEEARKASQGMEMSDQQRDDFIKGAMNEAPRLQHQWDLNAGVVREAQAMCVILARGHWVRNGKRIDFTKPTDLREAQPHMQHMQALQAEVQQIAAESRKAVADQLATVGPS